MRYIHTLIFLMTKDTKFLKECWGVEFIKGKFSWRKIFTRVIKNNDINFYFWWRLVNEMNIKGTKKQKKSSNKIHQSIKRKYNIDILLGIDIGIGLTIGHMNGVVINNKASIGKNFTIMQNCTIGGAKGNEINIVIGDNVTLGTNSVILGGNVKIGNNVIIGAMSFINKDIPDNCTVYTEKINKIIVKN